MTKAEEITKLKELIIDFIKVQCIPHADITIPTPPYKFLTIIDSDLNFYQFDTFGDNIAYSKDSIDSLSFTMLSSIVENSIRYDSKKNLSNFNNKVIAFQHYIKNTPSIVTNEHYEEADNLLNTVSKKENATKNVFKP